ncbi:MAG: VIT and vWA domain-containing protein [Anaerolineae bacterium]
MLNLSSFTNSAPAGTAVLEIVGPGEEPRAPAFVPLKRTTINGRWDGPLAAITVTHTYGYTRSQCDRVLEAVYRFPMPGDAAVYKAVVTFGEVEIAAELKERGEAEEAYEDAKRQGRQAALTTRESPDVFTLQIAGLQPDQEVVVETTYVQLAAPEGVGWSLRIPLTTAPRYTRADEPGSPSANGQPLATWRDPGHRFSLDLVSSSAGQITSRTHALVTTVEDDHARIRLADGELLPDRYCVLTWMPNQDEGRPTLTVLTSEDQAAGKTYFTALVAPPKALNVQRAPRREALILVDHSGSMDGVKRAAADQAVLGFAAGLAPQDSYNVGVFDHNSRWLGKDLLAAGNNAVRDVKRFLDQEPDGGGTNLGVALEQALLFTRRRGPVSRQVVIITDAQVVDEARILKMVEDEARGSDRRRISVLCIDTAPNSYIAQQIAKISGGIAQFLTSAAEEEDLARALQVIMEGWSQPVAVGLKLEVSGRSLELAEGRPAPSANPDWSAADLGDLTLGRSIWVAGRVAADQPAELVFRLAGSTLLQPALVNRISLANSSALKMIFGAWRVLGLERLANPTVNDIDIPAELTRLGYDPNLISAGRPAKSVYPENAQAAVHSTLEQLLLSEALDYGLLCSVTGFIAVRKEQGKPVEGQVRVGNALPDGWSGEFLVPQTILLAPMPAKRMLTGEIYLTSESFDMPFLQKSQGKLEERLADILLKLEALRSELRALTGQVTQEINQADDLFRQFERSRAVLQELLEHLRNLFPHALQEVHDLMALIGTILGMNGPDDQLRHLTGGMNQGAVSELERSLGRLKTVMAENEQMSYRLAELRQESALNRERLEAVGNEIAKLEQEAAAAGRRNDRLRDLGKMR